MSLYLDASVTVSLFVRDVHELAARRLTHDADLLIVSDFMAAEFTSAVARLNRIGKLDGATCRNVFAYFDAWARRSCQWIEMEPQDVRSAEILMRGLEFPLRTPDALHLAMARRLGAPLATFDAALSESARLSGVEVAGA